VEASRGCLHVCRHCPITPVYQGRFFVVPAETVLADIRAQAAAGATHITFGDPDFLNGVKHSLRIVRRLHGEFPDLSFDVTAKIEHIVRHRSVLAELGRLGCLFLVSAVESLDDTVLAHLDKGHTRADVIEALAITREAGIVLRPSLVPFTPWSTPESYLDMLEFVEQYDLVDHVDPVQYSIRLLLPPGSSLLGTPQMAPFLGPLDEKNFTYVWQHPDRRMDGLQLEVTKAVERAGRLGEDPTATFFQVKDLAFRSLDGRRPSLPRLERRRTTVRRLPRLTESWFCCAEPTSDQLVPVMSRRAGI
jgi:hypothetical protein